jgi:peptide methionine sulfoxide reductase msrA/msrB
VPAGSENISTADSEISKTIDTAIFAGGCFWGVEYYFRKEKGVKSTTVGYTGGWKENPRYDEVCSGKTGHYEAIEVVFNPAETSFENLAKLFFEIHDFSQQNGQGPDIGEQYKSAIFYKDDSQKTDSEKLINTLKNKGFGVATEIKPASGFWRAEEYHQDYYRKTGKMPYCHFHRKKF